jgi:peptide/nickel transport system substrate-binding protein
VVPAVAERVPTASGDGRTYTLRIRNGLHFTDGRPVRAADVEHSILRARAVGPEGRRLFAGLATSSSDNRKGTVRLVLRHPDPSFPHALAAVQAGVVPASTPMRALRDRPPAGIGPYRIESQRPGRGFLLARNRDFSLPGVPGGRLDEVVVEAGGSSAEQTEAVIADRLDVMIAPPPADRLPELRSELRERYSEHTGLDTLYLAVRSRGAAFGKSNLREALARALDRPEAARRLGGLVRPTCNVLPPLMPGHEETGSCPWGDPSEDPDLVRARELVEEAGEVGRPVAVWSPPATAAVARLYVATLRKVGLAATREPRRGADVRLLVARAPVPDPARFLMPLADRVPLVVDAETLLAADELAGTTDPEERERLAERVDARLLASAVVVPYAHSLRTVFLSGRIDAANCAAFHPVYGVDLTDLCLR